MKVICSDIGKCGRRGCPHFGIHDHSVKCLKPRCYDGLSVYCAAARQRNKPTLSGLIQTKCSVQKGRKIMKKLLHRIIVIWCLYGLGRLCIFVNPLLFRFAPLLGSWSNDPTDTWDSSRPDQIFLVWIVAFGALGTIFLAYLGVRAFADWLFSSSN